MGSVGLINSGVGTIYFPISRRGTDRPQGSVFPGLLGIRDGFSGSAERGAGCWQRARCHILEKAYQAQRLEHFGLADVDGREKQSAEDRCHSIIRMT